MRLRPMLEMGSDISLRFSVSRSLISLGNYSKLKQGADNKTNRGVKDTLKK
jgi:hypothetical protein